MFESLEDRRVLSSFPAPISSWQQAEFIDNQALVKFRADATPIQIQMALSMVQAQVVSTWDELDMMHVRFVTARGRDQTLAATKLLHENAMVEYAEPNFLRHLEQVPNDPLFLSQWGLHNVGQNSPFPPFFGGAFDADIDAVEAWDVLTGHPNTVIAIVDTGVDYTHPDLLANIWTNPNEIADGFDNDGNGFVDDIVGWDTFDNDNDPMDAEGHGTHVAGIAGAVGDNSLGVTGVSWDSKIMAIKASDDNGAFSSASIVGAQAFITRMKTAFGINIVASNNSYGALGPAAFSFAEFDAIRIATSAGIAFIAAAGNQGVNTDAPANPFYPANYNVPGIISVAATDRNDQLATFSNRGFFTVDLGAPGVEILSTFSSLGTPPAQPPAPNVPPPGYAWLDGTSMASPMVAGAYALIKTFDPQLTVAQIKNLLITTVDLLPSMINRSVSGGRLNLARALDEIPRNEFHGTIFLDLDGDGRFDPTETTQSGWTVYVDLNNNEVLDANEPSTVSVADGTYNLRAKLLRGTYFIREVVQNGWIQTFPGQSADFAHRVTVNTNTDVFEDLDFGNKPIPGSVSGVKYSDVNGNGQRDTGEPGLSGFVIYVDMNNDGIIGVGEPAAVTDSQGRFQINNIFPGIRTIREVQRPGFVQTEPDPSNPLQGGISVLVVGATVNSGLLFGNRAALDFGDAPASYGTLAANNGARHGLLPGFFLGDATDTSTAHIDDEANGIPTNDAEGDDLNNLDDEDGVSFLTTVVPGQDATIRVDVSSGSYGSGILQGWIDFNNDGDFLDAGEQILKNRTLTSGTHLFTFAVPGDAAVGDTFSRFRWSLQRDLGPTGPAVAGEVEDYTTAARALAPTANDDEFTVARDSTFINNEFDLLANDFPGVGGLPFTYFAVDSTTEQGGLAQIDVGNNTVRYQPPPGFVGDDTFHYQITDGVRVSNLGTVTVHVVPTDPIAVDDTFDIAVGSSNVVLDVLNNDIEGINGPLTIIAKSNPVPGGTLAITNGGTRLTFTPSSPSFTGAVTFNYFITDGTATSSASVLVQVGGPAPNQIVQIEYKVLNENGDELGVGGGIPAPQIDDTIILAAFTRDLRGSFPDPIFPALFPDASGVLSAYADALYDADVVRPVAANNAFGFEITFGPLYTNFQTATSSAPGIIDDAGATDTQFEYALGSGDNALFFIKFTVQATGTIKFLGNPEEDVTFETQVHSQADGSPTVVDNEDIFFKHSPSIQVGPSSEGEATNVFNPLDVNQDTLVTPNDASIVINHLNRFGAGPWNPMLAAASGQGVPQYYLDVNSDGSVSAFDAKLVVDYLNKMALQSSASSSQTQEGEADTSAAISQSLGPTFQSSSSSKSSSSDDSSDQADFANNVDQLLGGDVFASGGISAVTASVEDNDDHEKNDEDVFFADLESI